MLHMFFLAMALNPHVVRNAQEELDRVLGGRRLPDFSDQEQLPYISAIVKELLRWGCPVPIGVPKRVRKDCWIICIFGFLPSDHSVVCVYLYFENFPSSLVRFPSSPQFFHLI